MFFDNKKYFEFVEKCWEIGIQVLIILGLKFIKILSYIIFFFKFFKIDYLEEFSCELLKCKINVEVECFGVEWGIQQLKELKVVGVFCIYYYIMLNLEMVCKIVGEIF